VVLVITKNTGGTFSQRLLPGTYLAGVNLKSIGQFGYRLFSFERFQGYPGFK